eukprot:TRINITY_DN4678_c0_g1_i1.p2 TRINITY_DN4678_c0_g1~~TRINITY_DN4678_c0_g1_i1.p2  ORF type:complete len:123 (-),score=21.81 TRINITY_DN4678_c0_g1_i1:440-808(-)
MSEEKYIMTLPCPMIYAQVCITNEGLEFDYFDINKLIEQAIYEVHEDKEDKINFKIVTINQQTKKVIIGFAKEDRLKVLQALAVMNQYGEKFCRTQVERVSSFVAAFGGDSDEFVSSIQFPQ